MTYYYCTDTNFYNCDYNCQDRIKHYVRSVHSYLISRASYKREILNGIQIEVGECIVSMDKIAEKCFIEKWQVRKALEHLEKDGYIATRKVAQKETQHIRVIRVLKYAVFPKLFEKSSTTKGKETVQKVAVFNNTKRNEKYNLPILNGKRGNK